MDSAAYSTGSALEGCLETCTRLGGLTLRRELGMAFSTAAYLGRRETAPA